MNPEFANPLLWVPIPNGLAAPGVASIRVLVVPKLPQGKTIDDFGLTDWPGVLRGELGKVVVGLRTRVNGGGIGEFEATVLPPKDSSAWTGFFSGAAGGVDVSPEPNSRTVHVSDTHDDARRVADTYGSVTTKLLAGQPVNPPPHSPLPGDTIGQQIAANWRDAPTPVLVGEPDASASRRVDFHRAVALLREFPAVASALGLVFEVQVDAGVFTGNAVGTNHYALSVSPTDPPLLEALVTPVWTRYEWRRGMGKIPAVFRPAGEHRPPGTEGQDRASIRKGLIDLTAAQPILPPTTQPAAPESTTPEWAVAMFDVNAAASALRVAYAETGASSTTMPPVRSTGLTLLRTTQAEHARTAVRRGEARHGKVLADEEFTAEDLLLGYRIDIRQNEEGWRSLCGRDAVYHLNGKTLATGPDPEGHVKPFAAIKGHSPDPKIDRLVADQVVFRWDGWSLVVPRIDLTGAPEAPADVDPDAVPYAFTWEFDVPRGALPVLRFAGTYRIRLRYVDMAGGGPALAEADALESAGELSSSGFVYFRYDPIQPPFLGPGPREYATGSSADVLVVRSDPGHTPEALAAERGYPYPDERLMYPPTVPLTLVEQHGMFDERTDEVSWALIRGATSIGELNGRTPGLVDPAMGGLTAHVESPDGSTSPALEAHGTWGDLWSPTASIDRLLNPPPKSLVLKGSDVDDVPVTMLWRDPQLIVTVAKGVQRTIELSSTVARDKQDHLAVRLWPSDSIEIITNGRNQAISPVRRVTVVHAVRRPLFPPNWELPEQAVGRRPGQTLAVLHPTFAPSGLHTESTGRLDIRASWTDVTDDGPVAGRNTVDRTLDHFFSTPVESGAPAPRLAITHEFGDTKFRSVGYSLDAITRYREYFGVDDDPEDFHWNVPQPAVPIPSSARPNSLNLLGTYPAFTWDPVKVVGANRIEHRRAGRTIRLELGRPWFQTGDEEVLGVIVALNGTVAQDDSVTRIGRDPLFGTPPPESTHPDQAWFSNVAGPTREVTAPELVAPVTVVPMAVTPAGDRWQADVGMSLPGSGAASYAPMVRLAVARYQPNSLTEDAVQIVPHISTITLADRVPLLPDRLVAIDRTGSQVRVTVTGNGPAEPVNVVTAVIETASGPTDLIATGTPIAGVVAWTASGPPVSGPLGSALPPLSLPGPGTRIRVRITEHEAIAGRAPVTPAELGRRNVLVDTIDLPEGWHG